MRIKRRDLKLLIESLLSEAIADPNDKKWYIVRMVLNMLDKKKFPDYTDTELSRNFAKKWDSSDDELWGKITDEPIQPTPLESIQALKDKLDAAVIEGKSGYKDQFYNKTIKIIKDDTEFKKYINDVMNSDSYKKANAKPAEKSAKKAEDVSGQEGKIIQDPGAAGYHYKKIGDKHYIISSPKDKKVSEKNATFVDPNSMKGAFDAISKLFK